MQLFNPENTARVRLLYFVSSLKNLFLRFGSDSVFFCLFSFFARKRSGPTQEFETGFERGAEETQEEAKETDV